jgi:hypothetical protein
MAEMGDGYGSECHLLRYLGRHRCCFDDRVRSATGASVVRWRDFHFDPTKRWPDGEWKGVDFLRPDHPASLAWSGAWPQRGNPPNWDAVGVATINGKDEWLLVEAKAHIGEMVSDCHAKEESGLPIIRATLADVKRALDVPEACDWLKRYYQYANRLAVLRLLLCNKVPARLLFIYFVGDKRSDGISCPQNKVEWESALKEQATWLGLKDGHMLSNRIHTLFIPTHSGGGAMPKATPVGEGAAQCWMYVVKSKKIKVGQNQRTQMIADTAGCVELVCETIQNGQAAFIVQCKKEESGKCTNGHSVVTLRVTDKDGNHIVETKVEIICRHR